MTCLGWRWPFLLIQPHLILSRFTCSIEKFTYSYKRLPAVVYHFMSVKCSNNPWVLAVERANTFRGFSSFLLRGCIYIMSSACLTVRGAAFAPSFKHALVISFINHPRYEKQKRLCVLLSHGQHPTDSRSSCQTQKHPAGSLFRTMEFFYEEPLHLEKIKWG